MRFLHQTSRCVDVMGTAFLHMHVHTRLRPPALPFTDSLHAPVLFHLISLTHSHFAIFLESRESSDSCRSLFFSSLPLDLPHSLILFLCT